MGAGVLWVWVGGECLGGMDFPLDKFGGDETKRGGLSLAKGAGSRKLLLVSWEALDLDCGDMLMRRSQERWSWESAC